MFVPVLAAATEAYGTTFGIIEKEVATFPTG